MARGPVTKIAITGSQYRKKTRHRLDKMSRDLQVVVLESTPVLRYIQAILKSEVQSRIKPDRGKRALDLKKSRLARSHRNFSVRGSRPWNCKNTSLQE